MVKLPAVGFIHATYCVLLMFFCVSFWRSNLQVPDRQKHKHRLASFPLCMTAHYTARGMHLCIALVLLTSGPSLGAGG
jgi:hypothetical protein